MGRKWKGGANKTRNGRKWKKWRKEGLKRDEERNSHKEKVTKYA